MARFDGLKVTWLGHAAFLLESPKGKQVLIDPWISNPKAPKGVDLGKVDLILVTHGHSDHLGETVEIAKRTGATVACIFEISVYLSKQGLERVQGMNKGGSFLFDGIRVSMVDATHSSGINTESGEIYPGGEAAGFVVTFENGFRVYHMGDTGFTGSFGLIAEYYKPDLVLIPIGDLFTLGPKEAAFAVEILKPRWIIPMHYGTFPLLTGTPEAFREALSPAYRERLIVPQPGETVE